MHPRGLSACTSRLPSTRRSVTAASATCPSRPCSATALGSTLSSPGARPHREHGPRSTGPMRCACDTAAQLGPTSRTSSERGARRPPTNFWETTCHSGPSAGWKRKMKPGPRSRYVPASPTCGPWHACGLPRGLDAADAQTSRHGLRERCPGQVSENHASQLRWAVQGRPAALSWALGAPLARTRSRTGAAGRLRSAAGP